MRILVVAFWDRTVAPESVWQPLAALADTPAVPCRGAGDEAGPRWELLLLVPQDEAEVATRTSWGMAEAVVILPLELLLYLQPALLGRLVAPLITSRRPDLVLFAADRRGGNLAAAVAAELGCGLCAHVERIEAEPSAPPGPGPGPGLRPHPVYLVPSYGGLARMTSTGAWQMATVGTRLPPVRAPSGGTSTVLPRDGAPTGNAVTVPQRGGTPAGGTVQRPGGGRTGTVTVLAPVEGIPGVRTWEHLGPAQPDALDQDQVYPLVVGAGWGVGDRDGFELVKTLARVLGAPLVVTRPVVDEGWAPPELLVGQSGKRIRCRVYLAVGISGDPQHMVGVEADTVVAVNTDPRAPIYGHARLGVACDFRRLIPALLRCLETLR
ncbi:MAG: electron transfer flavoprotein subunit alpha/FixB family protein [Bacillota bacterium]|nr:electron transfer flavoprotein subunit alpha/FixB family protein [Bacillota bacterium]